MTQQEVEETTTRSDSASRVVRAAGLVIAATILGRITGFGREWMVARILGSNTLTDTYYAAFTLPNIITYLVAGGALGIILIPVFTQYVADGREDESWYVFSTVVTVMGLILLIFVVLGEIFAAQVAHWIAPGFAAEQQALLVTLIRILLPSQLFLCLGGILGAVHNAKGRFLVPALAPIVYNFTLIGCAWILHYRFGILSFALGVSTGTVLGFFGLPLVTMRGMNARFKPNLSINHPGMKRFLKLAVPVMLALSVDVTDVWIVRWFGSYLSSGSITWLMYSRYICIIPIAIIGQAAGIASYPFLSRLFAESKHAEFSRSIATGTKSLLLIMLPISSLTIVLSRPLVRLIFANTKLTEVDIQAIASALAIMAVGMFAKGAQPIVARGFSAAHNTLTPALIGTTMTFLSLPLYWFFARTWHYQGLAWASSIMAFIFVASLMIAFFQRFDQRNLRSVLACFGRLSIASLIGASVSYQAMIWLEGWFAWQTFSGAFMLLVIVTAIGLPLIFLLSRLLGVREVDQYFKKVYLSVPRIAMSSSG